MRFQVHDSSDLVLVSSQYFETAPIVDAASSQFGLVVLIG